MSRFKPRHYSAAACRSENASPRRFHENCDVRRGLMPCSCTAGPPPSAHFLHLFPGAANKDPLKPRLARTRATHKQKSNQTRRLAMPRHATKPQCDTKGRHGNGNQKDTHIFIPGGVAHQILHNVLRCTCTHSSTSSRPVHRHLGSVTLPRILSVFISLPLVGKTRCKFTVPRYSWNNYSGCSGRV